MAVIKTLPLFDSSEKLVSFICFSNNNFLLADEATLRFFEDLKKMNYDNLAVSALFSYLKIKYQENNWSLKYSEWAYVVPILLNPKISDIVFDFLIEMSIPEFLKITETEIEFMKAVCLHFHFIKIPYNFSWELRGFYNLFTFLKVEKSIINPLLEKTINQKSFDELRLFVKEYKFNFH